MFVQNTQQINWKSLPKFNDAADPFLFQFCSPVDVELEFHIDDVAGFGR